MLRPVSILPLLWSCCMGLAVPGHLAEQAFPAALKEALSNSAYAVPCLVPELTGALTVLRSPVGGKLAHWFSNLFDLGMFFYGPP